LVASLSDESNSMHAVTIAKAWRVFQAN
jgi:hypothetical protein